MYPTSGERSGRPNRERPGKYVRTNIKTVLNTKPETRSIELQRMVTSGVQVMGNKSCRARTVETGTSVLQLVDLRDTHGFFASIIGRDFLPLRRRQGQRLT